MEGNFDPLLGLVRDPRSISHRERIPLPRAILVSRLVLAFEEESYMYHMSAGQRLVCLLRNSTMNENTGMWTRSEASSPRWVHSSDPPWPSHRDLARSCLSDERRRVNFHPLSITLLATVAHQSKWDSNRLAREWKKHLTSVLRTEHNESLGATIEISLSSLLFKGLGPNVRKLPGVIALFPQGFNEDNLDWLFPTIPNVPTILDKLCMYPLSRIPERWSRCTYRHKAVVYSSRRVRWKKVQAPVRQRVPF